MLLSYGPEVFEMCLPQPLGTHYLDGKDGFRDEGAGGEGCGVFSNAQAAI